jgi:hypothetical protein
MVAGNAGSDEELMQLLATILDEVEVPPADLVDDAVSIFATRDLDAELLTLLSDSANADSALALRAETQPWRVMTFRGSALEVELELDLTGNTMLVGQLTPAAVDSLRLVVDGSATVDVDVDELGRFLVEPAPATGFRLVVTLTDGQQMMTPRLTL